MTVEQFVAILAAFTALIGVLGGILVQLRQTHGLVNGKMTELVAQTKLAAQKSGELAGRDWTSATETEVQPDVRRIARPIDRP